MHIASRLSICTDQGQNGNATHARGEAVVLRDHCNLQLLYSRFFSLNSCLVRREHIVYHGKQRLGSSLTH